MYLLWDNFKSKHLQERNDINYFLFSSRKVRVFFAEDNDTSNRSVTIRHSRGPRKNYIEAHETQEDSEDKPIQQSVLCIKLRVISY